jgi:opacity protein-like surface antigen
MINRVPIAGASLAALVLSASAAFADAAPLRGDGFVAIDGGGSKIALTSPSTPAFDGSASAVEFGGIAALEYDIAPRLGVQGDLVYRQQDWTSDQPGSFKQTDRQMEAAAHLFYRDDRMLLGAFGQIGRDTLYFDSDFSHGYQVDHVLGGLEGQLFLGDATLYAQAGATAFSDQASSDVDGWFATFEARYFLKPDFRVDGHAGIETFSSAGTNKGFYGFNTTLTKLNLGVGAEYRLADSPASLFARYDYYQGTFNSFDNRTDDHRVLVGVRFDFGAPSLEERDRHGASLKPFESHGLDESSPL